MTTFATGWFGTDLGAYRECGGTYDLYPADTLPALPALDGSFGWLTPDREPDVTYMEPAEVGLAAVVEALPAPIVLPSSFVSFMGQAPLRSAVPTCTLCWWGVSAAVPSPLGDGAYLVRFLNDQQDVLLWNLYLTPDGNHSVVCGGIPYDSFAASPDQARADLVTVALDFESFVYRFWVENLAWFELNEAGLRPDELTPAVREYVAQYRPRA